MSKNLLQKQMVFLLSFIVFINLSCINQAIAGKIQNAIREAYNECNTQFSNHVVHNHQPLSSSLPEEYDLTASKNALAYGGSSTLTPAQPDPYCIECNNWNNLKTSLFNILYNYRENNI